MLDNFEDITHILGDKYCVYALYSSEDILLYIGYTQNVHMRLRQHLTRAEIPFTRVWACYVATESDALGLEHVLIVRHKPPYNKQIYDYIGDAQKPRNLSVRPKKSFYVNRAVTKL